MARPRGSRYGIRLTRITCIAVGIGESRAKAETGLTSTQIALPMTELQELTKKKKLNLA